MARRKTNTEHNKIREQHATIPKHDFYNIIIILFMYKTISLTNAELPSGKTRCSLYFF